MTAHYTVVQYVPDPTADERVNFGVIVWDGERVLSRFVGDWRRVRAFGGEDIRFLRDFARSISEKTSAELRLPEVGDEIDPQTLTNMISEWSYSIQFTDPRGSLKSADALLGEAAGLYLREAARPVHRGARTRMAAVRIAHNSLFTAVQERAGEDVEEIVKRNETVEGRYDQHRFDVVLANGRLFGALHAISFEIRESEHLEKEVEATAWTLDDVRKRHRTLPLGVLVLPPKGKGSFPLYSRAVKVYRKLNAEVITEKKMDTWARQRAQTIPTRTAIS